MPTSNGSGRTGRAAGHLATCASARAARVRSVSQLTATESTGGIDGGGGLCHQTQQMEVCELFTARHHLGWRIYFAPRPLIAVVLIVLMAGNSMTGSFSGFVHVHDVVSFGHHHHHHDGGDRHHHDGRQQSDDAALPAVDFNGSAISDADRRADLGQLHIHGPIVTLGFVRVVEWSPQLMRPAWNPPPPDYLASDHLFESERPPRAVTAREGPYAFSTPL